MELVERDGVLRQLEALLASVARGSGHTDTARELEVLRLLCGGLKNSEIAERLCRSVRTVDHHVSALFAKLGVASRTEAVAAALQDGLVSGIGCAKWATGARDLGNRTLAATRQRTYRDRTRQMAVHRSDRRFSCPATWSSAPFPMACASR